MNKHTPGPWNRIKGDRNVYSAAGTVCKTPAILGGGSAATNWEANARLIAAAPDLLEALENLLDAYSKPDQRMCCIGTDCGCMGATIYDQAEHYARAAIARARGEA